MTELHCVSLSLGRQSTHFHCFLCVFLCLKDFRKNPKFHSPMVAFIEGFHCTTRQAGARRVSGFGRWKQDLHGARVDPRPEEASLLQDRS